MGLNTLGVCWPLAIEFWISLFLFPIIFKFKKNSIRIIYLMIIIVLTGMNFIFTNNNDSIYLGSHMMSYLDINYIQIPICMVRCMIGLALGILVYYLKPIIEAWIKDTTANKILTTIIFTVAELVLIYILFFVYIKHYWITRNTVVFLLLGALIVLLVSFEQNQGIVTKIFSLPVLHNYGKLYFGILMTHPFWVGLYKINFFKNHAKLGNCIFIVCTMITATIFYFTAERFGKLLNKKAQNFHLNS